MGTEQIRDAYGARSDEYVSALGSVSDMAHEDATLTEAWGRSVVGRVIDAGSGPGHWTDFLRTRGLDVTGVEVVPEFVDSARERFPESHFGLGGIDSLPAQDSELGGVIAWYSLIHMQPSSRSE